MAISTRRIRTYQSQGRRGWVRVPKRGTSSGGLYGPGLVPLVNGRDALHWPSSPRRGGVSG
jgi:hypothetical protein